MRLPKYELANLEINESYSLPVNNKVCVVTRVDDVWYSINYNNKYIEVYDCDLIEALEEL